jgi:hypothetical protein
LSDSFAIHDNKSRAIIIETITIHTLLISIKVDDGILLSCIDDEVKPLVELPELVMTSTGVGDDLNAVQAQVSMWTLGRKELLAGLRCKAGVGCTDNSISYWDLDSVSRLHIPYVKPLQTFKAP